MKRVLCLCAVGFAALVCGQGNVLAATSEPIKTMDEVVVTATRFSEEVSSIPANVTIISKTEISQSPAATVPELLRSTAGVLVNDITGNGRSYTVDLRGFGETAALNTLVLVDGRRVNQADLSGVDWALIPKARVERIEIVRGGRGSVLYGDNAAGGVINIITIKGYEDLKLAGGLSAGSYNTFQGGGTVSGATDLMRYALSASHHVSDGYRDNSDTDAMSLGLNMDFFLSDPISFNLSSGYLDDEASLPGALIQSDLDSGISRRATLHPDDFADTKDWYIQGGPQIFFTDNSYLKIEASFRKRESDYYSFFDNGTYQGQTEIETVRVSPQVTINEKLVGKSVKLILGFDYEDSTEDILNDSVYFGVPSINSYELSKENNGYFSHGEINLNEKMAVSAGYRHDRVHFTFSPVSSGESNSNTIAENLYTAGITYRFNDSFSGYTNYAKSFRYPVLDEMFNFYTNTVNGDLRAQTTDDYEAGLRYQGSDDLSVGLNLFWMETANEIFYNPVSYANENLDGDMLRRGVEFTVGKRILDVLLQGSYTFRDTKIEGGQYDKKELPNVPAHQFTVDAQTKLWENFLVNLNGIYVGERPFISDFSNSHPQQEDYFLVSGKVSYLLQQGSAYVAVKNILNKEYSEYGALNYAGEKGFYPSPKINFRVGVDFNF